MEDIYKTDEQQVRDLEFLINEERGGFAKFFKNFRLYNLFVMIAVLIIITLSVILLFPLGELGMGLALAIIITLLVGVIVYSKLMKRYTNNRGNTYMAFYYKHISDYVYGDLNLKDYQQDIGLQMTFDDFFDAKILKDITSAGSRNLVTYKLNKYDIKIADYAAYKQEGKQNQLVFVGKLMTVEGVKAPKGRVLIYRRPSAEAIKEAVGPTEVEGLSLTLEDSDLLVYTEQEEDKKFLSKKVLDQLRSFPQGLPFIDMTLSFIDSKLTIALSYNDDLMVIPLPVPFVGEATRIFKTNIEAIHQFIQLL